MNHKWWGQTTLNLGGHQRNYQKPIIFLNYYNALATAAQSFQDPNEGSSSFYSIPPGEDFVITGVHVKTDGTACTVLIGSANSIDTVTTTKYTLVLPASKYDHNYQLRETKITDVYMAFSSAIAAVIYIELFGYLVKQ